MRLARPSRRIMHCQIAVRPLDASTGEPSRARLDARLEMGDRFGRWHPARIGPIRTEAGVLAWPGIGRTARPSHAADSRYRVRLSASHHRLAWLTEAGGLTLTPPVFVVRPYSHDAPLPFASIPEARVVLTFPGPTTPLPAHVPVLRGTVRGPGGGGQPDVVVSHGDVRVITDERGVFGLPMGRARPGEVLIEAARLGDDRRTRVAFPFPDAIARGVVVEIP